IGFGNRNEGTDFHWTIYNIIRAGGNAGSIQIRQLVRAIPRSAFIKGIIKVGRPVMVVVPQKGHRKMGICKIPVSGCKWDWFYSFLRAYVVIMAPCGLSV